MKIKLNNFYIILSFLFFLSITTFFNNAFGNEIERNKTFGRGEPGVEKKDLDERVSKKYLSPANLNQLKDKDKELSHATVLKEENNYIFKGNQEMPFSRGNDGLRTPALAIHAEENIYIENMEIRQCNQSILKGVGFTVDQLLKPAIWTEGIPCEWSKWRHPGGLFEHESFGANTPGKEGWCYEYHKVSKAGLAKGLIPIGKFVIDFINPIAVPAEYTTATCWPRMLYGCTTWTIYADKIEYYFPVGKITLSKEPLYTRYIGRDALSPIFIKYMEAIEKEMKLPTASLTSLSTLSSFSNSDLAITPPNSTDRGFKSDKKGHISAPLGQKNRGYARFFPFLDIEAKLKLALGAEGTPVLPHVPSSKKYFGTDFDGDTGAGDIFFSPFGNSKENIAYFVNPGFGYVKSPSSQKKHIIHHSINQWAAANADTKGGGSKLYKTGAKNFVEFLKIPGNKEFAGVDRITPPEKDDYRENITAYGVGNISNLMSLTPSANSDYILQTLVRTHNMFLDEMKPADFDIIKNNDKLDAALYDNYPTHSIIAHPGLYFTVIEAPQVWAAGAAFTRQSFKTKWDLFHCPIYSADTSTKIPKSFNEFFNKDVNNVMEMDRLREGGAKLEAGSLLVKGDKCFKYEDMLRNNLDYLLVNTITPENKNMTTVANKGEISFTVYTLFSGTVGFPGMGMPFWTSGTGHVVGGGIPYPFEAIRPSTASPIILPKQFRLF